MSAFFQPDRSGRYPCVVSLVLLYAVSPAGKIVDHAIINALPDWHARAQLRYPMAIMRFNAAPDCQGLRPVVQPLEYNDRRYVMHWH